MTEPQTVSEPMFIESEDLGQTLPQAPCEGPIEEMEPPIIGTATPPKFLNEVNPVPAFFLRRAQARNQGLRNFIDVKCVPGETRVLPLEGVQCMLVKRRSELSAFDEYVLELYDIADPRVPLQSFKVLPAKNII